MTPADFQEWNDFASSSQWGDILQFWQWGEVKKTEGWNPVYIGEGSAVRSMGLVKKASFLGNILYIPHGPIFQTVQSLREGIGQWKESINKAAYENNCFVIEIDPKVGFLKEEILEEDIKDKSQQQKQDVINKNIQGLSHFYNNDIIDIFSGIGFQRTKRNMQPVYKLLYNLDLSEDELMGLMDKSTRYNIRYAAKKGVEVKEYLPDDPSIEKKVKEFYDLLKLTQQRAGGYPIRPYSTFVKLFEVFKGNNNISLFEASYEGDVIIMNISQRTKKWASSFYAASNRLHPNVKAPYLIRWESIKRAIEYGSKVYDFWGIIPKSEQHKGYSEHKLNFGGARIDHVGIMQLPINQTKAMIYNQILPMRSKFAGIKRNL